MRDKEDIIANIVVGITILTVLTFFIFAII
jgi:hypothetical protein